MRLKVHPLTPDRWPDLEALFGENGAYGGCWCMWWRTTRREFGEQAGEGNRRALRQIVEGGEIPGVLGYLEGEAVGWCSLAPREQFGSLERSPVLKRLDDEPVWSIVCFFVARGHRGQGIGREMLQGALDYAARSGARIVEAYPTIPKEGKLPSVSSFMGVPSLFRSVGFSESAHPSERRLIMRLTVD